MTCKIVHGYKGFNSNMTSYGWFQYKVGETYIIDGEIKPFSHGFHFCRNAADVLNYYGHESCRYAEVEVIGKLVNENDISVTNKLRIVRELTWAEMLEAMYRQEGVKIEDSPFPADKVIKARETGTLDKMLPSGTEFPVRFANGEKNILVVCRDRDHTYLITKYFMARYFPINVSHTNKGNWPASDMRKHVQEIYGMLPEDIRKAIIPMHIKQVAEGRIVECDDPAFLLSTVNIFGKNAWNPKRDCGDTQIDIFRNPATRIKRRLGGSSASWWWLRSVYNNSKFNAVNRIGDWRNIYYLQGLGVVIGFCIEAREARN